jgi:hypothetical protein
VTNINKIFSTSNDDSIKIIIDWFNKKYDKNLTVKDFEWMDNEDDEDYED